MLCIMYIKLEVSFVYTLTLLEVSILGTGAQCCGSGSVETVSFLWIRIRIKKWLDSESGSVSNDTDPDPTKTINLNSRVAGAAHF